MFARNIPIMHRNVDPWIKNVLKVTNNHDLNKFSVSIETSQHKIAFNVCNSDTTIQNCLPTLETSFPHKIVYFLGNTY